MQINVENVLWIYISQVVPVLRIALSKDANVQFSKTDLEKKLNKVAAEAKIAARKKYVVKDDESSDDESDDDSLLEDRQKTSGRGKTQAEHPSVRVLNRIVDTLDRMEDRLIRIEQKGDDMHEDISSLKISGTPEGRPFTSDKILLEHNFFIYSLLYRHRIHYKLTPTWI